MSKVVLRQFFLAIALFVLYTLVQTYHSFAAHPQFAERAGGLTLALLLAVPKAVLFGLPVGTGVALALLPIGRGAFRQGIFLAGTVTAILVFDDFALRDMWRALDARAMGESVDAWPRRFNDTTGAISGSVLHLLGRVGPEDLQPWPPKPPSDTTAFRPITDGRVIVRLSAATKYSQALTLTIPLILAGLVLGLGTWLQKVATFRTPRDERLFRLGLGWLVALAVPFALVPGGASFYELSSPRASMFWIAIPYLIAAIPAFLGWRALYRSDQLAAA